MKNFGQTHFASDLETFVGTSEYCKRHNQQRTDIYAISIQHIPVHWTAKTDWVNNKFNYDSHEHLKRYGDFKDMFKFLNNPKRWGTDIILWYHNGQKFDYWFIKDWLANNPDFVFCPTSTNDFHKDDFRVEYRYKNVYFWSESPSWVSCEIWLWNDEYQEHVIIQLHDSLKLVRASIKDWAHDFLSENGTFYQDLLADPWAQRKEEAYPHKTTLIDLAKKPLDLDYVTDKKGTTLYCKDGTSYDYRNVNDWPKMISDRVGNDVRIMVFVIKYLLIHHGINIPKSSRVCLTSGQYAINSLVHDWLKQANNRALVSIDGKVDDDLLWKEIFGCSQTERDDMDVPMRPYCIGGICTLKNDLIDQTLRGHFISLDVNSEYPFIATRPIPYGVPVETTTIPTNPDTYYFVEFTAKEIVQNVTNATPVIPVRWDLNLQIKQGDSHYVYKIGDSKSNLHVLVGKEEYEYLHNNAWFTIRGEQIVKVYEYSTRPWLAWYMRENNEIKIHAKGIERMNAKLKSNSTTGKLCQRPWREVRINPAFLIEHGVSKDKIREMYDDDVNHHLFEDFDLIIDKGANMIVTTYNPAQFTYLPAYARITSGGRAWLVSHMFELCTAFPDVICLYNDTDSIKFKVHDRDAVMKWLTDHKWLDDTALGMFKEEFHDQVRTFKLICPKKYLSGDEQGNLIINKCAFSGFKPEALDGKKITQVRSNMELPHTTSKRVAGGVLIIDGTAKLNKPGRYD